jgi:Ras-related protein Rab-32
MFKDNTTMEAVSKEKGFAGWFPVSAKDNINVEEAAHFLVQKIIDNDKWSLHRGQQDHGDGVDLLSYRNSKMGLTNDKKCQC